MHCGASYSRFSGAWLWKCCLLPPLGHWRNCARGWEHRIRHYQERHCKRERQRTACHLLYQHWDIISAPITWQREYSTYTRLYGNVSEKSTFLDMRLISLCLPDLSFSGACVGFLLGCLVSSNSTNPCSLSQLPKVYTTPPPPPHPHTITPFSKSAGTCSNWLWWIQIMDGLLDFVLVHHVTTVKGVWGVPVQLMLHLKCLQTLWLCTFVKCTSLILEHVVLF